MPARDLVCRMAIKTLRTLSPRWRARTDLFVEPYRQWVDWRSGLGDAVYVLHSLVRMVRPCTIVEIGSARGHSTCALALACAANGHGVVHAIDPHAQNEWTDVGTKGSTLEFLQDRLTQYELVEYCNVLRQTSQDASLGWQRPIDFLFIDGDHTLAGVRHDFEAFAPWLTPEALVAFHDSAWEHDRPWSSYAGEAWYRTEMGVPEYLSSLQERGYRSITLGPTPGLTIMHPHAGGYDFLRRVPSSAFEAVSGR